ncbi:MAG: thioredoxin fold domain-containing protein, partial [Bacteroidales bacterium]|nr:thioredoxin fold domain-containing protein [Bacteroidales bacterium]
MLDVRTKSEFKNGHIPDAGNLNFYALDFRKKLILLPRNQPIYLYCNTGYRSEKAAEILIENGYTDVYNLQHGIMEWELINLPVIVEPDASPDIDNKMTPERYHAILASGSPVFFDFYAPWCGPCRKMMPMIDSLMVEYHPEIQMHKVNVDASKKLVKELKLVGVPFLVLLNRGEIAFSKNGSITRNELTSLFD